MGGRCALQAQRCRGQLSCRVGGLAAGTTHEFRVVAHAVGGAVPSAESEASTPLQIPGVLHKILDAHVFPVDPLSLGDCPII